jgi:hypothetical protein
MEDAPEVRYERLKNAIQDAILRSFPNPERKGCPGAAVVREVAARREPVEDDAFQHITHCSPCYKEFLLYKDEFRALRRARGLKILVGAITLLIVCGAGAIYEIRYRREIAGVSGQAIFEAATIDLRNMSSVRGTERSASQSTAVSLPRKRLNLTIHLPFGNEPGNYEIRLLRSGETLITARAVAQLKEGIAVVDVKFDVSVYAPGEYSIGIRQMGRNWNDYPVTLR